MIKEDYAMENKVDADTTDKIYTMVKEWFETNKNNAWWIKRTEKEEIIKEYKRALYVYSCGEASTYSKGWLMGAKCLLDYERIDYEKLLNSVKEKINKDGKEIINKFFFE